MTFFESLAHLATWTDADLVRTLDPVLVRRWGWGEREKTFRAALHRCLANELDAAVAGHAVVAGEPEQITACARAAFGDLRGLIAGASDALLDLEPAAGEWSVRETLRHALQVEILYRAQITWSIERKDADPLDLPQTRRPLVAPEEVAGPRAGIIARFARERAITDNLAATCDDAALARPTAWGGGVFDNRFRLQRFATHLIEHTIQCETALEQVEPRRGDAPRVVRAISRARGMHERSTPPARLAELDAALAARVAALG